MNYRREHRSSRAALFDGLDGLGEGHLRASSSYAHEMNEHENDTAIDCLHDRFTFRKRRSAASSMYLSIFWSIYPLLDEMPESAAMHGLPCRILLGTVKGSANLL